MHPQAVLDEVISETTRLKKALAKGCGTQVRTSDETSLAKATALAWFNNHRPNLLTHVKEPELAAIDQPYKQILAASDRASSRSTYSALLKQILIALRILRQHEGMTTRATTGISTTDDSPDFSPLIPDDKMRRILRNRWLECRRCLDADAPLASIVMMGGLLEALLLARINKESDKRHIFTAKTAPKDPDSGKPQQLKEWSLRHYIDVSHEVGWISQSAKDIGEVLRDYRNYIHPFKELSHGVHLTSDDGQLLWEIAKSLSRQVIKSAVPS